MGAGGGVWHAAAARHCVRGNVQGDGCGCRVNGCNLAAARAWPVASPAVLYFVRAPCACSHAPRVYSEIFELSRHCCERRLTRPPGERCACGMHPAASESLSVCHGPEAGGHCVCGSVGDPAGASSLGTALDDRELVACACRLRVPLGQLRLRSRWAVHVKSGAVRPGPCVRRTGMHELQFGPGALAHPEGTRARIAGQYYFILTRSTTLS